MIYNYLSTAFRMLSKSKLYSAINIGGLAIGFAAALLIALLVREETSYDSWLPGHERVFTLETTFSIPGRAPKSLATTPIEVRAALEKDYAGLDAVTRMRAGSAETALAENNSAVITERLTKPSTPNTPATCARPWCSPPLPGSP